MKWAQQSPTLKTKKSKNSGNSGSRFPKREVSSWRSSMGSSSWRPRPKLPLMSRMLSSHWRVTSRYGLLSWWGDVDSICSWIIDFFCGQVNMEKRLEAQNPPRPTGGVQLGQNDGARKNVMAWLSRCSILWSVTLSLINAVLDHEEKTMMHSNTAQQCSEFLYMASASKRALFSVLLLLLLSPLDRIWTCSEI